ncbi:hypothetical protein TNCV_658511 [Trichonephila clavipes]|uniref:Uncharacterized protein n=1 Tax=Trichonephila clavipes TaxID=2585209 RepID=A0A8X6VQA5_TRICX|nr:hypothetical protein TNCV_658511 [Trichonephila clavipes]
MSTSSEVATEIQAACRRPAKYICAITRLDTPIPWYCPKCITSNSVRGGHRTGFRVLSSNGSMPYLADYVQEHRNARESNHTSLFLHPQEFSFTVFFSKTMDRAGTVLWAILCTNNDESDSVVLKRYFWSTLYKCLSKMDLRSLWSLHNHEYLTKLFCLIVPLPCFPVSGRPLLT